MGPNKILLAAAVIFAAVFFMSCEDEDCINNLGSVVTEERELNSFSSIDFARVGNIYLTQGSEQYLQIEANELLLEHLDTEVVGDELRVDIDKCTGDDNFVLNMFITIPDINELTISGVGNIHSANDWTLDELSLSLKGVGNAELSGTAEVFHINTDGVGDVDAFNLMTDICNVDVKGVGNVQVYVLEELDVHIKGSGNVYYKGDPDISIQIDGTGNLIDAN